MDTSRFRGKHVAIYAHDSSQMPRDASIGDQVRRCREYVATHGRVVVDGLVFCDPNERRAPRASRLRATHGARRIVVLHNVSTRDLRALVQRNFKYSTCDCVRFSSLLVNVTASKSSRWICYFVVAPRGARGRRWLPAGMA